MMKKPEILAPAGSMEALKAAIHAGCDAVYMGGSRFGARAYAENPLEEEMVKAIQYCHLHGVKLYMTVNTLLKKKELETELYAYLKPYYEAGLDAVIVQDMGVVRFVKKHFPGLSIHASTQMTLTQGISTEIFRDAPVTRIVPARELTLDELRQMREDTSLEIEVFVHGALCYCYSGQCLFSSMFGGRSGNRGRCAQPCRMPYEVNGKRRYILSPKELCSLEDIGELIDAGIDSFKIEGRMKRPSYTAFVTAMYRKYVDLYCSLGRDMYQEYIKKHDKEWQEDLRHLAELYNRNGFTDGYLKGKAGFIGGREPGQKGQMLSDLRPKHGGVFVGKVLSVGKYEVCYEACQEIGAGDVVEFRDSGQNVSYEYTLGKPIGKGERVNARYQKGCKISVGDSVYRTRDASLLQSIESAYLLTQRKIKIQGEFSAELGKKACLRVWNGKHEVLWEGERCEASKKQEATEESVRKCMLQTGDSPFAFDSFSVKLDRGLFLRVGALKEMRRNALSALEEKMSQFPEKRCAIPYTPETQQVQNGVEREKEHCLTVSVYNMGQVKAVIDNPNVLRVYLRTEMLSFEELKEAVDLVKQSGKEAFIAFPFIFRKEVWDLFLTEISGKQPALTENVDGYLIRNIESFLFVREQLKQPPERIMLDGNMYLFHEEAKRFWEEQGVFAVTLPVELTAEESKCLSFAKKAELVIYGCLPLMVSAQCIAKNTGGCVLADKGKNNTQILFQDNKKREFFGVNYCKYCYNVIYQKEPMYLTEKQYRGVAGSYRYEFTVETAEQVRQVLSGKVEASNTGHFTFGIQ